MDIERAAADVLRPYRWLALGVGLLVCTLATCAGIAQYRAGVNAREHAQLDAERDSSRARARRHEQLAREKFVLAEAKAHVADSIAALASHSAQVAIAHRSQLAHETVSPVVAEQLRLDSLAIDHLLAVAPAYAVSIESFRPATELALVAVGESQRADTLSQTLGKADTKAAHWRGVRQGIKGTVITAVVLTALGALLHAGGKL